MGIQSLQKFIEANCPNACVPVDLLKIARNVAVRRIGGGRNVRQPYYFSNRLCLVVDGECCLDRLYGGFYSDWVCGGQWNRMVQFLSVLIQTIQNNNIELAVFFNGSLEPQRMDDWINDQLSDRKKINQVMKHVETKGTPPPKIWWVPPVCLRTCLRMALRHLNVSVVCTMDDHHQEVIAFCREYNFHGLMAEDAEYAIFDPPRYFSAQLLKLTYKGSLETKEIIMDEVAKNLDLHPHRFCVFAALLGNSLLTEEDLAGFHKTLLSDTKAKATPESLIKAIVGFVRGLPTVDNLGAIGAQIFGKNCHDKIQKFEHCVQYYLNGTKDGFLRYRPTVQGHLQEPGCYPAVKNMSSGKILPKSNHQKPGKDNSTKDTQSHGDEDLFPKPPAGSSKFASETVENELSSLKAYQQATGCYNSSGDAPDIVVEPVNQSQTKAGVPNSNHVNENLKQAQISDENVYNGNAVSSTPHVNGSLLPSSSTSTSSDNSTPSRQSPEVIWSANQQQQKSEPGSYRGQANIDLPKLPRIPPEVMRTASERHQKGLMSPWIYQVLSQGEIKISGTFEEDIPREFPSPSYLYRPLRQMVYAIMFNLHHLKFVAKQKKEKGVEEKIPEIVIKEWVWNKTKQYQFPDLVSASPLGWAVPTIQRLWFGANADDKKRRMRALLTCLRSDTPLMLNTSYVPHHLLIMCCVLRYIMTDPDRPILRKQELDAFLAQAVSPHLMNAQHTQNLQLPVINSRGIYLAALFMQGVECALFANDACGAPIPWLMCCPWLFFDGKLFHHKLIKANGAKNLVEVCDSQIDQVAKVERMRNAILEGLQVEFARPPPPPPPPLMAPPPPISGLHGPPFLPPAPSLSLRGRGRGITGRQRVVARGGQLEIAGVVVGSWGPNYGQMPPRSRGLNLPPQVTSVGGLRRYGPGTGLGHGYIPRRAPFTKIRKPGQINTQVTKKKTKKQKQTKESTAGKTANVIVVNGIEEKKTSPAVKAEEGNEVSVVSSKANPCAKEESKESSLVNDLIDGQSEDVH